MSSQIGIVGVPIETVRGDQFDSYSAYLPGNTDCIREKLLHELKDYNVTDLGELKLNDNERPEYYPSPHEIVPFFVSDGIPRVDIEKLKSERERILNTNFDLLLAIGASHLGGMILYSDNDRVFRADYHPDFVEGYTGDPTYSTYMNWVWDNITQPEIHEMIQCNDEQMVKRHPLPSRNHFNHFDIDIDAFDLRYKMQSLFTHYHGEPGLTPDEIIKHVRENKPQKIGIWEYRHSYNDPEGNGLQFIIDCCLSAQDGNS